MSSCGSPASTALLWLISHRLVKTITSVQHGHVLCICSSAVTVVHKPGICVLWHSAALVGSCMGLLLESNGWLVALGPGALAGLSSYHTPRAGMTVPERCRWPPALQRGDPIMLALSRPLNELVVF